MQRRLTLSILNIAIAVALFFGSGAQWLVLQSVAWTNMLITYSQDAPLSEAIQKTFDGQHPCQLCEHIQSAEKETQKEDATTSSSSSSLSNFLKAGALPGQLSITPPRGEYHSYPSVATRFSSRTTEPIAPPPRRG